MSDPTIRITLVRHGESTANRTLRWQGQGDSPLSTLGCAQAEAAARRLIPRSYALIVASDLERASATARALGRPFERDASFREFDIGAWEGLTREQVAERFPDELKRLEAGEDVALGGGESYAAFCARVDAAIARLAARLGAGEHALVFCHGGVIGVLVARALGLRGVRELPLARPFNTSITELAFGPDGNPRVRVFNDSLHLAALSLFPHPVEMVRSLGLVCEQAPHASFGAFGARYDLREHARELELDELSLTNVFERMRVRHPEQRVALSASAVHIHGWALETLSPPAGSQAHIEVPQSGSLSHFAPGSTRPVLVDYGVSA